MTGGRGHKKREDEDEDDWAKSAAEGQVAQVLPSMARAQLGSTYRAP